MRHKQQRLLEQNIQYLETYIQEHKLDITPESMILAITEADPDWQNFKNSKWLIKNLLAKNFLWEDIKSGKTSKAFDTLSRFLNIRKQWSESSIKDIQAYKGLSGIAEAIRPFEITKSMGELKKEEKAKMYSETIVVYDKNDYLVVIPKTEEASCFWGRGTEWCTASTRSDNYFNDYHPDGPLIIAITPDNRKYQFHKNSSPMDENDQEIDNITDPVLVELALLTGQISLIKDIDYTNFKHAKLAIQQDGLMIQYINKDIQESFNKDIMKELYFLAVQQNGLAIEDIDKNIPEYIELCKLAVQQNGLAIEDIDKNIPEYIELCRLAVQQNGLAIQYINKDTPEYIELCNLAVKQNGYAIQYINKDIPEYLELCKLAVQQNGYAIQYINKDIPEYLELCNLALQQNGLAIRYIGKDILEYVELCKLAVQCHGEPIEYIDKDIPEYFELCKLAVQQHGLAIRHIGKDIPEYFELCKLAVQQKGWVISFIDKDIPEYFELCKLAIQQNRGAIKYINKDIPEYMELCKLANNNPHSESEIINEIPKTENIIPDWLTNKDYEEIITNLENLNIPKIEKASSYVLS